MKAKHYIFPLAALLAVSCVNNAPKDAAEDVTAVPEADTAGVRNPEMVLVSKGVIRSANEVQVFSRIEGQLLDVKLLEGTEVGRGEVLFRLDDWELSGKLSMSRTALEQAKLRMDEILVGQGYKREHLDEVPENIREYARIKSGVNACESDLAFNKARYEKAVIKAPMSGVVTGVKALPYSFVKPGETLCVIVDPKNLIVEFSILETELRKFSLGTKIDVRAIAYSDEPYTATVRSIGSVVGESGMVKIQAELEDAGKLIPGMTAVVNL